MLENGEHRPTLFVETVTGGITLIVFADFEYENTLAKQKALFAIARKCAKEQTGAELRQVAFVVEAWLSRDTSYKAPSEDPKRREALCVWTLDVDGKNLSQDGYMAEIIRHGDIIDLAKYDKLGKVHNNLLLSFLAGFVSAEMSDQELKQMMDRL